MTSVDEVVPSPDGEWFAFTVIRGRGANEVYGLPLLRGRSRADVWLISTRGGEARNLTMGHRDGTGYWNPIWSPDSRRLAVLSTAGGDNIRPFVIDRETDALRQLSDSGVDLELNAGAGALMDRRAMTWLNDTTLLLSLLPEGELSTVLTLQSPRYARLVIPEWKRAERGHVSTASVLESGIDLPEDARPTRELVSINVISGVTEVLAHGRFSSITVSPDRHQTIAATAATSAMLPHLRRHFSELRTAGGRTVRMHGRLALIKESGQLQWVTGVLDPEPYERGRSAKWSEDGKWLAVIGKLSSTEDVPTTAFVVSAITGHADRIGPPAFVALSVAWFGRWLFLRGLDPSGGSDDVRWWAWDSRHPTRAPRLIDGLDSGVPERLWSMAGIEGPVGFIAGDLWRFEPRSGSAKKLTSTFDPPIDRVIWPSSEELRPAWGFETSPYGLQTRASVESVLVSATSDGSAELYRLQIQGQSPVLQATRVATPEANAEVVAYSPRANVVAFLSRGPTGTFFWTRSAAQQDSLELRLTLNTHLAGIDEGHVRTITYQGGDGQILRAMLLFPIGYQQGKRYPLITRVYPGLMISEHGHPSGRKEYPSPQHSLQLFAAREYAVLFPSIPLPAGSEAIDPFFEITKNVLPAVDKVVAMGIADPTRLGVYGHSQGSYATLALLTQTRRFSAAAVTAVFGVNLIEHYTQYELAHRYSSFAHELHQGYTLEGFTPGSAFRLRATPWDDLQRYVRNSPVFHLHMITTPLLILHGDLDNPISQAEAVFTGLYRLGRRARFVRYWGEGHNFDSPANIRNAWYQVFLWFDEHLKRR